VEHAVDAEVENVEGALEGCLHYEGAGGRVLGVQVLLIDAAGERSFCSMSWLWISESSCNVIDGYPKWIFIEHEIKVLNLSS